MSKRLIEALRDCTKPLSAADRHGLLKMIEEFSIAPAADALTDEQERDAVRQKLTDEQRKHIARVVHTDCTLIPGATFYNAAELAIEATLLALKSDSATTEL